MDEDVSLWIIDFLLRQPLHDKILDKLLHVLPLPIHDSSFKKAMLVRKIVSEISKGMASEEMLLLMERIHELDYQAGVTASEAMKVAYCDVAVDCTVRLLEDSQVRKSKYYDTVKRIWRGRVLKMGMTGNVGLISDVLLDWRDDIEASIWNSNVDEDLLKKWRGFEALKSVKVYVAEAWEAMGPSFLEHVVQTVGNEQINQVLKHSTCPVFDQDLSSVEFQSSSAVNNLNPSCPMDVENLSTAKSDEAIGVNETQNNISRKPCLMERNSTAHVHELDESVGSSDGNRLHLPSPSKRRVSPLEILEMENLGKRKKRRWSIVEKDTLRAGVEKLI